MFSIAQCDTFHLFDIRLQYDVLFVDYYRKNLSADGYGIVADPWNDNPGPFTVVFTMQM